MTQHLVSATTVSSYSSAFPPLQAFPWAFHKQSSFHHASPTSSAASTPSSYASSSSSSSSHHPLSLFAALAPPKYPAYLKHTTYASLAMDQYQHLQHKKNKKNSSDNDYYNKELVEADLRLPQYWNINDKSRHLHIGLNGHELTYHAHQSMPGPGKKELTTAAEAAASIRTNFPMRPQCGVYYYEITIVSMGNDGLFAVGLCNASHALDKLPGASLGSFGYHGQNGQTYQQNAKGTAYGPTYGHGDVIGCGVNYFDGTIFFTKNGISLGVAFESVDLSSVVLYYPCVGLSTPGEKMTANFGQTEFAFDIVQYIKDQQRRVVDQVCHVPVEPLPQDRYKSDIKSQVDAMVLCYLTHQGYIGTANAMKKNMDYVVGHALPTTTSNHDSRLDQDTRSSIRKSIMTGHVDLAVQQTEAMYPTLLENNADLLFQLKARKFLDILIEDQPPFSVHSLCSTLSDLNSDDTYDDSTLSAQSGTHRAQSTTSSNSNNNDIQQLATVGHHHHYNAPPLVSPPLPVAASGRRLSWAAIAASPSSFADSHLEEHHSLQSNHGARTRRRVSSSSSSSSSSSHHHHHVDRRHSSSSSSSSSCISLFEDEEGPKTMTTVRKAMHYGQQLQDEYQHTKYWSQLMDLFTLLSFADPKSSPMGHLLDTSRRDVVASDLNDAIQAYQHQANKSNLEWVLRQAIVTSKELALSGHGKASLTHMQNQFTSTA